MFRIIKKCIKKMFNVLFLVKERFVLYFFGSYYNCFIIGVPTYGNLGDIGISIAQKMFLNDRGIKFKEITFDEYYRNKSLIVKKCEGKIVFLQGGGNMGDVWQKEENLRRDVLISIKAKHFILFPQTIFYTNTNKGLEEQNKSVRYYANRNDLTIFVREERSFNLACTIYKGTKVYLIPDMVFYLNNRFKFKVKRCNRILLILRHDKEKSIDSSFIEELLSPLKHIKVDYSDTVIPKTIYKTRRKRILKKKFNEFSSYNLILTDRLHGMIFSYITKTSCIVFDNNTGKVGGVYKWIESIPWIAFSGSISLDESFVACFLATNNQSDTCVLDYSLLESVIYYYVRS